MNTNKAGRLVLSLFLLFVIFCKIHEVPAQGPNTAYKPAVPRTWDEVALTDLEVPLAGLGHSPKHMSADDYYRIPVRPIYRSYPIYQPDKARKGYREWVRQHEPVIVWDDREHRPTLVTEEDWIKAGEIVFNAPVLFSVEGDDLEFDARTGDLYDKSGISPFATYVVRNRGKLETGEVSCASAQERRGQWSCLDDQCGF